MELLIDILGYGFIFVVIITILYVFVRILLDGLKALTKDND